MPLVTGTLRLFSLLPRGSNYNAAIIRDLGMCKGAALTTCGKSERAHLLFCRTATQGTNAPMASTSVDNGAVLRIVLGGSPGWAAISTVTGLYYGDPFDTSFTPGERHVLADLHSDICVS